MADYNIDLLDVVKECIDELNLGVSTNIGVLSEKESISIFMLPSGTSTTYMDGTIEQRLNIQVDAKFKKQRSSYNSLGKIQQRIMSGVGLSSRNGSYTFDDVGLTNSPHLSSYDEANNYIYSVTFFIDVELSNN